MSNKIPLEAKQEISALFSNTLEKLAKNNANSCSELLTFFQEMHTIYNEVSLSILQQYTEKLHAADNSLASFGQIEADSIVVEAIDKNTGILIRRNLPVSYRESDNGLILSGETFEGKPSHIAFFSDAALSRLKDIMGQGPDSHRCGE